METAFLPIFASLPSPTPEEELEQVRMGQLSYAAAGVTTAQEGATHAAQVEVLQRAAEAGALSSAPDDPRGLCHRESMIHVT
jgi:hypothetical protein